MKRLLLLLLLPILAAASASNKSSVQSVEGLDQSKASTNEQSAPVEVRQLGVDLNKSPYAAGAPVHYLNWLTVDGGGVTNVNGTNFDLGLSAGQTASGFVSGTNFKLGVGYWYGAVGGSCPISLPGDVNTNGAISSSDIIVLVNYVFKAGPAPLPCTANGDVNCNGAVSSSDIIYTVNKVFRAGPEPCNICSIIPSVWSCP